MRFAIFNVMELRATKRENLVTLQWDLHRLVGDGCL